MTSPLLPYANSYLLITALLPPEIQSGRITQPEGTAYLVRCYLKRQDSTGTTSGADYLPTQSSPGNTLPGTSGAAYLYRGYALRWTAAPSPYTPGAEPVDTSNVWQSISPDTKPTWLTEGVSATHIQGLQLPKPTIIESCSGKYGGTAIDAIISREINGIPLLIRSGDLTT